MNNSTNAVAAILFLIVLALLMPFAYIWAWNTLFGAHIFIEMNFWTWLATVLLTGALTVRRTK